MVKILRLTLIVCGGLFLLFVSLQSLSVESSLSMPATPTILIPSTPTPLAFKEIPNIDDLPLRDNPVIYQNDDPDSVVTMYVTIRKGNVSDNTNYTWDEVNTFSKWFYTNNEVVTVGQADAILQVGDENGPVPGELGYGELMPNATIQIRGASTSLERQKSYKIELKPNSGDWRGQTTIALNKHVFDPSRIRNKLNFDLMKQIPNMLSLRTQFVHLYVKDETEGNQSAARFVDYGLFTQVEQPNKTYLRSHLLDSNGQFYKTTFFEFRRYSEDIRLVTDPLYDFNSFSSKLESKGSQDHSKIIQMLDDLNNNTIPIKESFEKYFDKDNYFTWLAYNILVGDVDTQSQNFYLYSPQHGNKWYFIPWDYDSTFFRRSRIDMGYYPYDHYEYGIANYWGSVLANKVLRNEEYRQVLDVKVKELMKFLTPERIKNMVDSYRAAVEPYTYRTPDVQFNHFSKSLRDQDYELMPSEVQVNYDLYLESLQTSMPFYLGTPVQEGDQIRFSWDESYNFSGEDVTYHFVLSENWDYKDVLFESTSMRGLTFVVPMLKPGVYYWQVTAVNEKNKTAYPFDITWDPEGGPHSGMKSFFITTDGQVVER